MVQQHVDNDADITVGCIEVPLQEARDFGVMSVDENFEIKKFTEKPQNPEPVPGRDDMALASMGIYVFSMSFLTKVLIADAEDENSDHDFGKNIIPKCIEASRAFAYPYLNGKGEPAYWRDVGTLYSYWKANIELCDIEPELNLYNRDWPIWTYQTQSPPAKFAFDDNDRRGQAIDSLVAGGCIISGAKVKRSVIFFNTHIETGSYIKDSVILPKIRIGKNCTIKNAIIDKGTVIPDNFEVGVDLEKDRERFLVTEEGIVLVTPGQMNQRLHFERD
jgi:glucose-1-phosphate adenylyltransferase